MSPYLPVTPDEIADAAHRRRGGRCRHPASSRARPRDRPARPGPGGFRAVPAAASSRAPMRSINITTGGSPYMKVEERVQPAAQLQAGGGLAQHGVDEFRALSHCSTGTRLQVSTGSGRTSRPRRDLVFRNTFKDIEYILTALRRQRHALRVRVLRHRAPLQPRAFRRPRAGQAALLRAVASSASSAASAPIRRMWRT